jgi:hypothetical protein
MAINFTENVNFIEKREDFSHCHCERTAQRREERQGNANKNTLLWHQHYGVL